MLSQKVAKIESLYHEVYDEYGNVKLCGREKCMHLISLLNELRDEMGGLDFGNLDTGFMNVDNIKAIVGISHKVKEEKVVTPIQSETFTGYWSTCPKCNHSWGGETKEECPICKIKFKV